MPALLAPTAVRLVVAVLAVQLAAAQWEYRLAGGPNKATGRLEAKRPGTSFWGTICDDGFGTKEADVACRSLGLRAIGKSSTVASNKEGTGTIHMDDVRCNGNEASLDRCAYITDHNCGHHEDVWLRCKWDYRLTPVGASRSFEGRLEVRPAPTDAWGTVCDDSFGNEDAAVACRTLGKSTEHASAVAAGSARQGSASQQIFMDNVACTGSEAYLDLCTYSSTHNCRHTEDVWLRCGVPTKTASQSATARPTPTRTRSTSSSLTRSPTKSITASISGQTHTRTKAHSETHTLQRSRTATVSVTRSRITQSASVSLTPTPSTSHTATRSREPTRSRTASARTPSRSQPTPTRTTSLSHTRSAATLSRTQSLSRTATPTSSATRRPTRSYTATRSFTATRTRPTTSRTITCSLTLSLSKRIPPPVVPVRVALPKPVAVATQAAVSTTSTLSAVGSPAGALQMARVVGALELAKSCRARLAVTEAEAAKATLGAQLEFPQSLLPFVAIGDGPGRWHRGAILGNAAVVIVGSVLGLIGTSLVVRLRLFVPRSVSDAAREGSAPPVGLATAAVRAARMPGTCVIGAALGLDGLVSGSVVLLSHDALSASTDLAVAGAGLVVVSLTLFVAITGVAKTARAAPSSVAFAPLQYFPRAQCLGGCIQRGVPVLTSRLARWTFANDHAWFPAAALFTEPEKAMNAASPPELAQQQALLETHGLLVARYRAPPPPGSAAHSNTNGRAAAVCAALCPWFLLVDLGGAVAASAAQGLGTSGHCGVAMPLAVAANAACALAALLLRPYSVPLKNALLVAMNALTLGASALSMAAVNAASEHASARHATRAGRLASAAAMVGFLSLGVSIAKFVVVKVALRARMVVDAERLRARRAAVTTAAFPADVLPLLSEQELHEANAAGALVAPSPGDNAETLDGGERVDAATSASQDDHDPLRAQWYSSDPARRVQRTAEGQRRFDELEAMLSGAMPPSSTNDADIIDATDNIAFPGPAEAFDADDIDAILDAVPHTATIGFDGSGQVATAPVPATNTTTARHNNRGADAAFDIL